MRVPLAAVQRCLSLVFSEGFGRWYRRNVVTLRTHNPYLVISVMLQLFEIYQSLPMSVLLPG